MIIDEVISKYLTKKQQRKLLLLTSLQWMAVAAGVMILPLTLPSIISDIPGGSEMQGTVASSVFMGMLIGALISGIFSDRFGRKITNIAFLLNAIVFTFLSGMSGSATQFAVYRLLSGIGFGGLLPVVNAYMSEFSPIKNRGRYLTLLESSWAIGSIMIGLFSVLTVDSIGWRPSYFVLAGYSLLLLFIAFMLPESPKFAYIKGGKQALEKVLNKNIEENIEMHEPRKTPLLQLLKGKYLTRTIMIWLAWFSVSFSYYGIFTWAPKLFEAKGLSAVSASWYTFFMLIMQLPGYLFATYLIDKVGRKKTGIFFFAGTGIAILLLLFVNTQSLLFIFAVVMSIFNMGAWGLVYAYTPELYPTEMRSSANGTSGVMARISGIIAPYFTASLMVLGNVFGITTITLTIMFVMLLTAFFFSKFGIETMDKAIE
ncbi:MAG: MFS transporter [Kosmotogaceae bacterium]